MALAGPWGTLLERHMISNHTLNKAKQLSKTNVLEHPKYS